MNPPGILAKKPEVKPSQKPFHGRKILIWEGLVPLENIKGWVSNPRLDQEIKVFKDRTAGREPNDDEIFSIMKNIKDFRLKSLAADIRVNGVRQPIIVTSTGKLLDGNRRYYATRLVREMMNSDDPDLLDFTTIPAWVLDKSCSEDDEERILVQENFYPSEKVEWPHFVKAKRIYANLQRGDDIGTVVQRYHWSRAKVNETRRIMELIDEFIMFATSDPDSEEEIEGLGLSDLEAESIAAQRYQQFNEAQKSFRVRLDSDFEFKKQFFTWIYQGKFASFPEVRIAEKAYDHPKAKRMLMADDQKAGKKARALVEYEQNVEREQIIAEDAIDDFVAFLAGLTTQQKQEMSEDSIDKLKTALSTVLDMIEGTKK